MWGVRRGGEGRGMGPFLRKLKKWLICSCLRKRRVGGAPKVIARTRHFQKGERGNRVEGEGRRDEKPDIRKRAKGVKTGNEKLL